MSSRRKIVNKAVDMFTDWMRKDKDAQAEGVKRLGLPENNTAADRAKAMGFSDETYYHGTNKDFNSFDINKSGDSFSNYEGAIPRDGIWMTDSPAQATWYADVATKGLYGEKNIGNPVIYPLKVRSKNPYKVPEQDWLEEGEAIVDDVGSMIKKGYDSTQLNQAEYIHMDNIYPNGASIKQINEYWNNPPVKQGANHVQSYSPTNIRSPFAHFNPKYAGVGAGSILSTDLLADELDSETPNVERIGLINQYDPDKIQGIIDFGKDVVKDPAILGEVIGGGILSAARAASPWIKGLGLGLLLDSGEAQAAEDPNFINRLKQKGLL